ncbi:creatininase family protein [Cohnella herbarum]|uniref:Creatininase family protein n=1 Tax=Cohnella herbarum TaxID=2728023 RepID=A0A7Z2VJV1_9BACL|nr:creatininase family protein [Cohnella herbarum]QJD84566.1 creatininase family protein [Cohnella herbarum]
MMQLTHMRPDQIQEAVRNGTPVVMAAGVIEYHGYHLPIGTDILLASHVAEEAARRSGSIVAPPLAYGPTLSWAGGPDEGEIDFDPAAFKGYVKEALRGLLKIGFRRIYILQHHQGAEGLQSLACRMAAAELIRETTAAWGAGWGRKAPDDTPEPNIFGLIKVAGLDDFGDYAAGNPERMPVGHAGKGETQLMMAAAPETVRMEHFHLNGSDLPEWLLDTLEATESEGKRWIELCVEGWTRELLGSH